MAKKQPKIEERITFQEVIERAKVEWSEQEIIEPSKDWLSPERAAVTEALMRRLLLALLSPVRIEELKNLVDRIIDVGTRSALTLNRNRAKILAGLKLKKKESAAGGP